MRDHPLVLLIDDEDDFLEIASVKLQGEGFDTVMTHSVPEALAKAEELQPDLVLSDIYMPPGPSGWEFALAARRNPKLQSIKLAFFTSLRDPMIELGEMERKMATRELNGIRFFSKFDISDLSTGVRKLIDTE